MLKLYHNDMSSCAQKVRFVLHEKGLEWQSQVLDLRAGDQLQEDFLRLNPKGLVPALVHDDEVFVESNVIIEYLNEAFPDPPLLPKDAAARTRARHWLKRLDDGLHLETIALSFAIAFRHQLIAACETEAGLEKHFASIPDPYVQAVQREVVPAGIESPRFRQAISEFQAVIVDLNSSLAKQRWIVGDKLGLADIAYAPYATRLEHLGLGQMWQGKPHFARWYRELKETEGYRAGLANWFNAKYLPLMADAGAAAWPRIQQILDSP